MPHLMKRNFTLAIIALALCCSACSKNENNPYQTSKPSSHAGFALAGNYLYSVDRHDLVSYNIQDPAAPVKLGVTPLHAAIDTIFTAPGSLIAGATGYQMQSFSATDIAQLKMQYKGWDSKAQIVSDGANFYVIRNSTYSFGQLMTYDGSNAAASNDPSLQPSFRMGVLNEDCNSIALLDSTLYLCTKSQLYAIAITKDTMIITSSQSFPNAALEELSVIGHELACRAYDKYYFFDLQQPRTPVLLAKLSR